MTDINKIKGKVIVAGGRDFNDAVLVDATLEGIPISELVSGGAVGADKLGEQYAAYWGIHVTQFLPNWKYYGMRAGILRNQQMGDYADALVAFWDGKSKGTAHMIKYMQSLDKPTLVVRYDNNRV